jgi:hypothetical protein
MGKSSSKSLTLDEDLPFQRKQWRAERIGWLVMGALIAYSLAGGLGSGGPLSTTEAVSKDGTVRVHYEKYARQLTPNGVEITARQAPDGHDLQIHLSGNYLHAMAVRSVAPEPSASRAADSGYLFTFERLAGVVEAKIEMQVEPQKIGTVEGWLAVNNGERLAIKQFVFP